MESDWRQIWPNLKEEKTLGKKASSDWDKMRIDNFPFIQMIPSNDNAAIGWLAHAHWQRHIQLICSFNLFSILFWFGMQKWNQWIDGSVEVWMNVSLWSGVVWLDVLGFKWWNKLRQNCSSHIYSFQWKVGEIESGKPAKWFIIHHKLYSDAAALMVF